MVSIDPDAPPAWLSVDEEGQRFESSSTMTNSLLRRVFNPITITLRYSKAASSGAAGYQADPAGGVLQQDKWNRSTCTFPTTTTAGSIVEQQDTGSSSGMTSRAGMTMPAPSEQSAHHQRLGSLPENAAASFSSDLRRPDSSTTTKASSPLLRPSPQHGFSGMRGEELVVTVPQIVAMMESQEFAVLVEVVELLLRPGPEIETVGAEQALLGLDLVADDDEVEQARLAYAQLRRELHNIRCTVLQVGLIIAFCSAIHYPWDG